MEFWTDPIKVIYEWLMITFTGWGMAGWLADILINLIGIVGLIMAAMVLDIMLVWVERKVVARFQGRLGPNRVGPWGLFQPFPDIIKLIIKEDITPAGADKVVFNLAPILSLASVIFLWAVLPLAANVYGVDLNVALLYLVAAGAIGTLSIIMAGWASNNKYALLGAYRMVAVMISYEIPMIVALLIPTLLAGTMSMKGITLAQQEGLWFVLLSPLGMLLFLVAAIAELGRSPFDLSEGESEIVAGYMTEYSGMKWALFYLAEYFNFFIVCIIGATLFLGGWNGPILPGYVWLIVKVYALVLLGMWIRMTWPRFRVDQLMNFAWKVLVPVALVNIILAGLALPVLKMIGF